MIVDLFCGIGGWTRAFLERGHCVIGIDIVRHDRYPAAADFELADCLSLDGGRFRGADLVIASSPCDEFSPFRMPWTRARSPKHPDRGIALFRAAERIARDAGAPLVLENVQSAQRFVGRAVANIGPFYLWGDGVPALLPKRITMRKKESYGSHQRAERAEIPIEVARAIARFY